ncbi:antA/AntB antirepressor family protein [Capnocytophaga granulosa]|jgi:antA/antB antirepressor domain protein|uniref:antA/AntB antirepressor family protein n=1 Tax=Capnocytophaga granulosa TaxID=45242 RepID=UPI0023F2806C|nr:antA/AntB antirepressor family protein [Capnocytophaga granulosa]
MNELVKITEQEGIQLVDARELHRKLQTGRDFSNWIKGRIQEYGFIRNEDYFIEDNQHNYTENQILRQNGRKVEKGRPTINYHLSLNMAKELAMVERNEQGRKIRRYFIEMEKIALQTIIKMPKSLNIYGMEALPYVEWLLLHNYSVTSGQYHARIRKHPQHFYKASTGKWYINKAFAEQLLEIRSSCEKLKEVKGLPQVHQMTIFEVIAEVKAEQEKLNQPKQ